ncbi:MAG: trypsin-like peptidase domain-containing protein [Flavobacteriales bacterium]|nr:trypsin-like peptidase domain-containing protein [Flavobacteriales bacterium]
MKKLFLALVVLFSFLNAYTQSEPFGLTLSQDQFDLIRTDILPTFDHERLLAEDTEIEEKGGRTNFGRIIPSGMNEENVGVWTDLGNGDRIWQYRFKSEGAKGLCVYFNDLYLPLGSSLVFYPADRSYVVGPFGNHDCKANGKFMVGEILGDEGVLEYYEPSTVVGEARIGMHGIAHLYRYVYGSEEEQRGGGSDVCEVDVNCPEGAEWTAERDGVVRLQITEGQFVGLCSASLVNTTAKDCRKYILTAMHCGVNVSDSDWDLCSVRFKYQRASCGSGSAPTLNNRVGVNFLADSNDGGGDTGSDFLLLELEDEIPSGWNPFFCGWNAETSAASSGVCIHHPSGDSKKISATSNIVSGTYSATGFHWRVVWHETETNWGVTEGGSSGSPLFDPNHRIVGTLTGGGSFCSSPSSPDYYGKMSKHWTANPNAADQKLKVWLDPNNTGLLTMDGSYVHAGASSPCDPSITSVDKDIQFDDMKIFPSICDALLTINVVNFRNITEVRVFDNSGKMVKTLGLNQPSISMSTDDLADGLYYITFVGTEGRFITQKFAVRH